MRVIAFIIKFCIVMVCTTSTCHLTASDNPIQIDSIGQIQETCNLGNGQLTIHVPSNLTAYEFSIDAGITWQKSNVFPGLESDDYLVIVRNGDSCSKTITAQVADAPVPTIKLEAECITGKNRVRISSKTEGGISPLSFSWDGPNGYTNNQEFLSEAIPGFYIVTVTDALGCSYSDSITVQECCSMEFSCNLKDSLLFCVDVIPASPFGPSSNGISKDETILSLADLGINVNIGSCGDLTVTTTDTANSPSDCIQDTLKIIRDYTISDSHTTFTCSQEFILVDHLPVTLDSPAFNADGLCGLTLDTEFEYWLNNMGGMIHSACSAPITVSTLPQNPTIDNFCGASTKVTFLVEDGCGNTSSSSATFSVIDNQVPEVNCPDDLTINPTDPNLSTILQTWTIKASTTDNCGNPQLQDDLDPSAISTDCSSQPMIPVTFTSLDVCGLEANCTAIINIIAPNSSVLICGDDLTINCHEDKTATIDEWIKAFYTEDSNGNIDTPSNDLFLPEVLSLACNEFTEVAFSYEDECFRIQACNKRITIIDDDEPSITCPADLEIVTDISNPVETVNLWLENAQAIDNCTNDPVVTNDFMADLTDLCSWNGDLIIRFSTEDACGNSVQCESKIIVTVHSPDITCPQPLTLACGFPDLTNEISRWSATASASGHDGNTIETTQDLDITAIACSDISTFTFSVTNNCGVNANCSSTITIVDEESPKLSCPENISIDLFSPNLKDQISRWVASASATDCNSYEITDDLIIDYQNLTCTEVIPVNYSAIDACNLTSNCQSTLTLINRSELSLECPESISLLCTDPQLESLIQAHLAKIIVHSQNSVELTQLYNESFLDRDCITLEEIEITTIAVDNCNNRADCISTIIIEPDPAIYIPNVFSPDNDGLNDYFTVFGNSSIATIRTLIIYNRWGDKVFETADILPNDDKAGWNGYYNNKIEGDNAYTYYIIAVDTRGNEIEKAGSLQIIKQ